MRYGPTDAHRPPHQDHRSPYQDHRRDHDLFGAGSLQELTEASRPETDAGEFSGGQCGGGVRSGRFGGVLSGGPSLGGGVIRCAARDSLGHFTGPRGTHADPDPVTKPDVTKPDAETERDRQREPLDVQPYELSGSATGLAQAASGDPGA